MNKIPNPEEPNNSLPVLPPMVDLKDPDILIASMRASRAVSQLRTRLTLNKRTIANAIDLFSPLFVPEAVASSGVENIITTNDSVYIAKIEKTRELEPVEKETLRYTEAIEQGAHMVNNRGFLATNDYIRLQKILEPAQNGIRNYVGTTLKNPFTKKIYYTPPVGERKIRDLLANFENYYNEKAPTHEIYARMAILHYQFEAIHPFGDGNGRTGRILMPLYLMVQQELPVPVLFISQYILNNKDNYYELLRGVTFKNDWKSWVLFIIKATEKQADYTTYILQKIQDNLGKTKALLKEKYANLYSSELVDFLFSRAYFTEKDFETEIRVSQVTARKYLAILEKEGILAKKKQPKKNRYLYVNKKYTDVILNI